LLDGVAAAGVRRSIGVSALHGGPVQPPAHCVSNCLGGDPAAWQQMGCPFLVAALSGEPNFALLEDGRCRRGLRISVHQTNIGARLATLVGVEDDSAAPPDTGPDYLASATGLIERVEQLSEENHGFANDLLQTYEQLNLIFDLTQQLAKVTDPAEIERLLLGNVRRVIHSAAVWMDVQAPADAAATPTAAVPTETLLPPEARRELAALIEQVRQSGQVRIGELGGRPLICGPLPRLEGPPDVVVAHCDAGRDVITAGDMMLVDAVLSFGGQLRCNAALHERLRRTATDVTRALVAAIDKKDHYTCGHSERVGYLTGMLAAELGVPPGERRNMEWSGLLHDIGKIGVPEAILCKPGILTPEEFEVIKGHPRMGFEILEPIGILQTILDGVLYHHEYLDGAGYPEGLRGDDIPLVARIIHVADIFDALTTSRSYRAGYSLERCMSIILSERGTRSDAAAIDALVRLIERHRTQPHSEFTTHFPCVLEAADAVA
jgi:HD-GYP domain-containing protein (c-di-GMP phosphodiesterase class II)